MEINIITKNNENEMIRVNIRNPENEFDKLIIEEFDKTGVLITSFDIPIKSIVGLINGIDQERIMQN